MELDYYRHEALDRASLMANMVETHLFDHPYVQDRPELMKLVGQAVALLASAYQEIGADHA